MNLLELKAELEKLSPDQLQQPLVIWGEGIAKRHGVFVMLTEDYIDPSGEGAEPVSIFLNDPEYGKEFVDDQPLTAKKGEVFIELRDKLNG